MNSLIMLVSRMFRGNQDTTIDILELYGPQTHNALIIYPTDSKREK
jgi:hypothetical protein